MQYVVAITQADRSLMLLLVLVYQPASNMQDASLEPDIQYNPFLQALTSLADDEALFQAEKNSVNACSISFTHLYNALATCIYEETALLLFYSLLHRNAAFREFFFAKSDVDGLLVPLMESLYIQPELSCNRVYMILIVLLILSQVCEDVAPLDNFIRFFILLFMCVIVSACRPQDSSFSENVNGRVLLASVPWVKERVLHDMSLGSLILVLLFRLMQLNLAKLRDPYLHQNCLATLSNMVRT
jgi:hypothetical protein